MPRKRFRMPADILRPARLTTAEGHPAGTTRTKGGGRALCRRKGMQKTVRDTGAGNQPRSPKRRSAFRIGKTTARTRRTAPPEPKDREPTRRCRSETSERSTKGSRQTVRKKIRREVRSGKHRSGTERPLPERRTDDTFRSPGKAHRRSRPRFGTVRSLCSRGDAYQTIGSRPILCR